VVKNAAAMADVFKGAGMRMIGGGTSNHLILADVSALGMSGGEAEALLDRAGITLNKNVIADDARPPMDPSGIRFGTPALTTRGFTEKDCTYVAQLMLEVLSKNSDAATAFAREKVRALAGAHPIPDSF
jgi:glycine hydroxymethyltransferase